jgi:hypothetical protein
MNVEIRIETPIFLFWEYFFRNFGILSLQCTIELSFKSKGNAAMPRGVGLLIVGEMGSFGWHNISHSAGSVTIQNIIIFKYVMVIYHTIQVHMKSKTVHAIFKIYLFISFELVKVSWI